MEELSDNYDLYPVLSLLMEGENNYYWWNDKVSRDSFSKNLHEGISVSRRAGSSVLPCGTLDLLSAVGSQAGARLHPRVHGQNLASENTQFQVRMERKKPILRDYLMQQK